MCDPGMTISREGVRELKRGLMRAEVGPKGK